MHSVIIFLRTAQSGQHLADAFCKSALEPYQLAPQQQPLSNALSFGKWAAFTTEAESFRIHLIVPSEKMMLRYRAYGFEFMATTPQGEIIIFDSADPTQFREVRGLVEIVRPFQGSLPCILLADNCEDSNAWSLADLYTAFRLDPNGSLKIFQCKSGDHRSESIRDSLSITLEQIVNSYQL